MSNSGNLYTRQDPCSPVVPPTLTSRPHHPLSRAPRALLILALLLLWPDQARANDKFRNTWAYKFSSLTERIKQKLRATARRKFAMPIFRNVRKPLRRRVLKKRGGKSDLLLNVKAKSKVFDVKAKSKDQRGQETFKLGNRPLMLQHMAILQARADRYQQASKRLKKSAKKALKANDFKTYKRRMIGANRLEKMALSARGELYIMMAQLKRTDELRKAREKEGQSNFKRLEKRARADTGRSQKSQQRHQVSVLKTTLKMLSSKVEMLTAQAKVAQLEGDSINARQLQRQAAELRQERRTVKDQLNGLEAQLATARVQRSTQSAGQQAALDNFRRKSITPKYLAGKITDALTLLQKYEAFGTSASALAGEAY